MSAPDTSIRKQWWLAELNSHGNPTLTDGPHSSIKGVEQAMYLIQRLGFAKDRKFAAVFLKIANVEARAHGTKESALNTLNSIGIKP